MHEKFIRCKIVFVDKHLYVRLLNLHIQQKCAITIRTLRLRYVCACWSRIYYSTNYLPDSIVNYKSIIVITLRRANTNIDVRTFNGANLKIFQLIKCSLSQLHWPQKRVTFRLKRTLILIAVTIFHSNCVIEVCISSCHNYFTC